MAGDEPTEKTPVPTFNKQAGEEGEVGSSARSYLRRWRHGTACGSEGRGTVGRLDLDLLSDENGAQYFKAWVKERFMDVEVTQVGRVMSQFFRVLKRGHDQCGAFRASSTG